MCGISGIINKDNQVVKKIDIQKMNDLIVHRGPDDEGFFFENNFAFGHRRLAVLDLSNDGHQPMHYLNKYTIIYNGEIYNYLEIKKKLLKQGYSFNSHSDTEVILASYDKWGKDCVKRFNGMWAFAIYDKDKNIIFCSRDRFGVKPFYYYSDNKKFIFASEIKQILEFLDKRNVNIEILVSYLVTKIQEYSEETFFKNVYKLKPSHNLIYDLNSDSVDINKYYNININKKIQQLSLEKSIDLYKKKLYKAIDYRLRSDVKVGSCISGGLDSSSIANIASSKYFQSTNLKFIGIHAKSIEKSSDESKYAKIVANEANIDLHIVKPSVDDFIKSIEEVVYTQEEPFGSTSIFMQYFVMKKAKELGCIVMLDGQGGDETLLGYEKYYPSVYIDIYKKYGFFSFLKSIRDSSRNNKKMHIKNIVKYVIGTHFSQLRKKVHLKQCNFIKNKYVHNFNFLDELANRYMNIAEMQKYEITNTNLPILLRYEDKNSMKHSIETRLPFIDFKTLEIALSINNKYKINKGWTKYILRKIIEKLLPKSIVWRKNKFGFQSPENVWINSISSIMKDEISNSLILGTICEKNKMLANFDNMDKLLKWRLYNIAIWEKIYNVEID